MFSVVRLSVQKRIIILVGMSFVMTTCMATFTYVKLQTLRALQDDGATRAEQALAVEELGGMGPRLYQVVADTEINLNLAESRKAWSTIKAEAMTDFATAEKIADTADEKARMKDARAAFDGLVSLYESSLVPMLEKANAITEESKKIDEQIDAQVKALGEAAAFVVKSITAESAAGDQAFDAAAASTAFWTTGISLAGLGLLFVASFFMIRDVSRSLRGMASELRIGAQQVASASSQVASSAQQLSQGSTEQAASLEETSASMEEMASMTRKNAENSRSAADKMAETASHVGRADSALHELVATMSGIRESSGKVTKIIKTIDEIAFQTNILALNAAVEAARAGEAGMGFAVVADEVRNLAQRSAQAAKDTATLIEESASNAQAGGVKVEAVVQAINAIAESSAVVKGLIDEVSTASQQQAQGFDQVTQAITQMEKVTQTTAASAEESAAASEELNAQAEQSMTVVTSLEILVDADATGSARSQVAARRPAAKVVQMKPGPRGAAPKAAPSSAEQQIPFENTGTFGSF